MNVSKSIGFIRLQTPPGLRKSGIPDSVDMPAPVKTTVRAEPARSAARRGIADMAALCGVPRTGGKSIPFKDFKLADSRHAGILAHWPEALDIPPEHRPWSAMRSKVNGPCHHRATDNL